METHPSQEPVLIYDRIEANRRKTLFLLGVFAIVLLPFAIYVTQYIMFVIGISLLSKDITNDPALTMVIAFNLALASVVLATYLTYRNASRIVLRIVKARTPKSGEARELKRIVENLCIGSGLPQPRLAIMDSFATNAFATGLDPEHATLVVTRGLLEALDRQEIEGVIAQKLSKIGNYDIRLSTILAALVTIMWLPLMIIKAFFRILFRLPKALGHDRESPVGCFVFCFIVFGLPLIYSTVAVFTALVQLMAIDPVGGGLLFVLTLLPLYIFLCAPFIGLLILRAVSREREFLADADAALLTRYPAGLAQALAKIGAAGNAKIQINPAMANLYIVNPLSEGGHFWDRMISSHPPINERIDILVRMGGVTPSMLRKAHEAGVKFHQAVAGLRLDALKFK